MSGMSVSSQLLPFANGSFDVVNMAEQTSANGQQRTLSQVIKLIISTLGSA